LSTPDVTAESLRTRGELHPAAARHRHITKIPPDPKGRCQICGVAGGDQPLHVFSPVVDHGTGQRITVAICHLCIVHAITADPPSRPIETTRRKAKAR
jgi:hypothetical protein